MVEEKLGECCADGEYMDMKMDGGIHHQRCFGVDAKGKEGVWEWRDVH